MKARILSLCLATLLLASLPTTSAATVGTTHLEAPLDLPSEGNAEWDCLDTSKPSSNASACSVYAWGLVYYAGWSAENLYYGGQCMVIKAFGGTCPTPDRVFAKPA